MNPKIPYNIFRNILLIFNRACINTNILITINFLEVIISYIKDWLFINRMESEILYILLIIQQQRCQEIVNMKIFIFKNLSLNIYAIKA